MAVVNMYTELLSAITKSGHELGDVSWISDGQQRVDINSMIEVLKRYNYDDQRHSNENLPPVLENYIVHFSDDTELHRAIHTLSEWLNDRSDEFEDFDRQGDDPNTKEWWQFSRSAYPESPKLDPISVLKNRLDEDGAWAVVLPFGPCFILSDD